MKRILREKNKPPPVRMKEDLNRIQTQFDDLISQMMLAKITLVKRAQGDDDDFNINFHKDSTEDYTDPYE
jgi:hypothetical protein